MEVRIDTDEIIREISDLSHEKGYVFALLMTVYKDHFYDPSKAVDKDPRNEISFQEVAFILGHLVKSEINLEPQPFETLDRYISETYRLLREMQLSYVRRGMDKMLGVPGGKDLSEDPDEAVGGLFIGEGMVEPIHYGDSGAYDFQYADFAPRIYVEDRKWLEDNVGLGIDKMVQFANVLKKLVQERHNDPKKRSILVSAVAKGDWATFCEELLSSFSFLPEEMEHDTLSQLSTFLSQFSCDSEHVDEGFFRPGDLNTIEARPLIKLPGGRYLVLDTFNLFRSIYESPFYWMVKDEAYLNQLADSRGRSTENLVYDLIRSAFGGEKLYRRLVVREEGKKDVSEIDVLFIIGDKALIIQAKSKKLSLKARRGSQEAQLRDFQLSVQADYDSALKIRQILLSDKCRLFQEDGTELDLPITIDDAYILCLSRYHFPAVLQHVRSFLKKPKDAPNPLAFSVFDLDLILEYLKDPYDFLYYIRQRTCLSEKVIATGEIIYLAYHLRYKLFQSKYDYEGLDESFALTIDQDILYRRGFCLDPDYNPKDVFHSWHNEDFDKLVAHVKQTGLPGFTDIILFLFDLAGDGADRLVEAIKEVKRRSEMDGKFHDASIPDQECGVTIVSGTEINSIEKRLIPLAEARKYKTKANKWIGFGCLAHSPNMVDLAIFKKERWQQSDQLEDLVSAVLKQGTLVKITKPGRNEPCHCGSKRKYKKCCLDYDERQNRSS